MTTAYVSDGNSIRHIAGAAITSGEVIEYADCVGVAAAAAAIGATVTVHVEGEFTLAKETGVAFTVGDKLYWDATNNNLDKTDTNIPAGICTEAAASGATTAKVKLVPGLG